MRGGSDRNRGELRGCCRLDGLVNRWFRAIYSWTVVDNDEGGVVSRLGRGFASRKNGWGVRQGSEKPCRRVDRSAEGPKLHRRPYRLGQLAISTTWKGVEYSPHNVQVSG